ncbi:MAG: hypothetical protein Q9161_008011 [Pseudevernia consocians]
MGILVRLIGSGVGLAAEAIAAKKQRSRSRSPGADLSPQASASSSRDIRPSSSSFTNKSEEKSSAALEAHEDFETPPPSYEQVVEVPEERADELIADGKALPLDEKHGLSQEREVHEDDDSDSDSEGDEANWALDEAAEEVATPRAEDPKLKYGIMAQPTIESFSAVVMAKCPPLNHLTNPLQRPVIIPQRRPGARDRGFIHAYSPDLAEKGISQEAFLSFIQNFHAASQASPLLNVVSVSAGVAGLVPEPITQITSIVIQFAAGAAIYLQTTQRTHSFLDEMNDKLFKPRGLYAMVMKYIPQGTRPISVQQADLNTMISKENAPHKSYQNFRAVNAGRSYGAIEMPDSAPLIFPALDEAAQTQDPAKANNLKNRMAFVADYYDKRAQASYLHKNPGQRLDVPQPDFATRVSDPNHPAFRGSLLTLFSGGKIPPKAERRAWRREKRIQAGGAPSRKMEKKAWKQKRKLMKQNVLYLMIVNLPTEQEMEAAKVRVQREEAGMR